ncbi:MAG: hemolysin III family protein [Myxococcota bacterium]
MRNKVTIGVLKDPFSALSHIMGLVLAVIGVLYLIVQTANDTAQLTATFCYGVGLCSVFLASSLYHFFDLGKRGNRWLLKFDHIAIFLMIGGSMVPSAVQLLGGAWQVVVLSCVALFTSAGVAFKLFWFDSPEWLSTSLFVLMGWSALVPLYQMYPNLTPGLLFWLLSGGLAYTVGALVYAFERPDPWPRTFGHHEIWHVFVLLGAGCHFWFNSIILGPR